LTRACAAAGDDVVALSRTGAVPDGDGEDLAVDLRDRDGVRSALRDVAPDVVYHLAALSSVGRSWEDPARTVQENVTTAVNLLEAVRLESPAARVVWVSTCEVYGAPAQLPVSEDAPLQPVNPYAVSKTTGDLLAAVYADAYELEIVRMRPFSHVGPGQQPIFILSSLARQAAEGRIAGAGKIQIVTGNPDTRRHLDAAGSTNCFGQAVLRRLSQRGPGRRQRGRPHREQQRLPKLPYDARLVARAL